MKRDFLNKIAEETGLSNDDEILAYAHFCYGADMIDGVILYGDVQLEFYREILKESSEKIKRAEKKFSENLANRKTKKKESPLGEEAKKEYEKYLDLFLKKGLIIKPQEIRMSSEKYPILTGYNYFNDPEIYNIKNTENSEKRELRIY